MEEKETYKSALNVQKGIQQPPSVNPDIIRKMKGTRKKRYSVDEYVSGILSGNRTILSQAITLLESSHPRHFDIAQKVIESCLPHSARSIRIGITGVPGAGKSTFIRHSGSFSQGEAESLLFLQLTPAAQIQEGAS
jgi:LAO/AO transport system kinase